MLTGIDYIFSGMSSQVRLPQAEYSQLLKDHTRNHLSHIHPSSAGILGVRHSLLSTGPRPTKLRACGGRDWIARVFLFRSVSFVTQGAGRATRLEIIHASGGGKSLPSMSGFGIGLKGKRVSGVCRLSPVSRMRSRQGKGRLGRAAHVAFIAQAYYQRGIT